MTTETQPESNVRHVVALEVDKHTYELLADRHQAERPAEAFGTFVSRFVYFSSEPRIPGDARNVAADRTLVEPEVYKLKCHVKSLEADKDALGAMLLEERAATRKAVEQAKTDAAAFQKILAEQAGRLATYESSAFVRGFARLFLGVPTRFLSGF